MTTKFSPEEVQKIARLSSLELTEKETEVFAEQFSGIMEYFELLKTAEIPDVVTKVDESHLGDSRKDKMIKSPVSPEQFSPYLEGWIFQSTEGDRSGKLNMTGKQKKYLRALAHPLKPLANLGKHGLSPEKQARN